MAKMTKEENIELSAEVLTPIISIIDQAVKLYDVERLKETLADMRSQTGYVQAWPMQETMDKADSMKLANEMYGHIINMMEIRINQRNLAMSQQEGTAGNQVLKQLGLM